MTGYLLDTNIVSETRKRQPNRGLLSWITQLDPAAAWLSTIVVGELALGVARLGRTNAEKAAELREWLADLTDQFPDRILPIDVEIAHAWGLIGADRPLPVADALIAATAVVHDLTVVARNVRDFDGVPVRVHNPFSP